MLSLSILIKTKKKCFKKFKQVHRKELNGREENLNNLTGYTTIFTCIIPFDQKKFKTKGYL